jgi:subtilase family serine protease
MPKSPSVLTAAIFVCFHAALAAPLERLDRAVDEQALASVPGSRPPTVGRDLGALAPGSALSGVTLVLSRTSAQEQELRSLIEAQHDPASSLYHRWLTPDGFADRFGMAEGDLAKIASWLESHGLTVESVSRSRDRIRFSGSAAQIAAAFGAELHAYDIGGENGFAPATELRVPAALAPMVQAVRNLSTFRPKPRVRIGLPKAAIARFTSSTTGNHFLTPVDIGTIYNLAPAWNAGLDGSGQSIAVVGQSAISVSDIEHFQSAAGVRVHDPVQILVPGSGTSVRVKGDESESDLDIEYASAIAPGATIDFVYVGNNANFGVFDALGYVVDNDIAPVVSVSYGACELSLSSADHAALSGMLAQAAAQGQSVIAASGDAGSTDCQGFAGLSTATQESLAVDFPASSQYVTAMGGTEFAADAVAAGNTTYWSAAKGADNVASALSYIPEQVWNDDAADAALSSGGGGESVLTSRPTWQSGVPGIPAGSRRLVPDISLASSADNAGYLFCSSDPDTGITGSCSTGFRDSGGVFLTVAGGTSFAAPIFAGMLALINAKLSSNGEGVAAAKLYALAADAATYANAFHDVTAGSNACAAGPTLCSTAGSSAYSATAGYDEASGLGSIDFANLLAAWPNAVAALPKSFTLAATDTSVAAGASGISTVTISPVNGYAGTIAWTISSTPALSSGCFTFGPVTVSGGAKAAASLVISATASCAGSAVRMPGPDSTGATSALPAFFLLGLPVRRRRRRSSLLAMAGAALVLAGCGGAAPSSPTSEVTSVKGTYTVTIVGTDTTSPAITASTAMRVTIQ